MLKRSAESHRPQRPASGASPEVMWIVRHGESAGNAARDAAEQAGMAEIALPSRDVDVPLSTRGERQAHAVASFFAQMARAELPTVVLTSPYVRAVQTAEIMVEAARLPKNILRDERLREREFGWTDGLTRRGIEERLPSEARRRASVGKFYYRPPGGESWCDVILRVRSFVDSLRLEQAGERVLVVAHQVVVLAFRYVLERMTEAEILEVDSRGDVANCSVTSFIRRASRNAAPRLELELFNHVAPIVQQGEPVTVKEDVSLASR